MSDFFSKLMGHEEEVVQESNLKHKEAPFFVYVLILVLYIGSYIGLRLAARNSGALIELGRAKLPIAAFTGVFSAISNMCLVFLVVFFNRLGLYTSVIILLIQVPEIITGMIAQHNFSGLPGLFSNLLTFVVILLIYRRNVAIEKYRVFDVERYRERQLYTQRLFEQTATALVNAIDAKDEFSQGHSVRVAEYSEKIARELGKSEEECNRIYYTALLHDVGKIGIPEEIINKRGRLTDEEYDIIKTHSVAGSRILSEISENPYLSIGAHFHHERYDGKGYPEGLKGEEIPEMARIIAVADAFDAMSSNRSYRDAFPPQVVREELIKGMGTQFDPMFSKIMQHLIDKEVEHMLKEKKVAVEQVWNNNLECGRYRETFTEGILITPNMTTVRFGFTSKGGSGRQAPAVILYDSLDGTIHAGEKSARDTNYFEYCEIFGDGHVERKGARNMQVKTVREYDPETRPAGVGEKVSYVIEAVKMKDHVLIRIKEREKVIEVTVALPDSSRYVFFSLTGEDCSISDLNVSKAEKPVSESYITRIADEVSYINAPVGDIPNLQIDGHRSECSDGILLTDGMKITFHTQSLPTARLVWHCPYAVLFSSNDKKVNGQNYRELALIRIDGESSNDDPGSDNRMLISRIEDFEGWEAWKRANRKGFDCELKFERKGEKIITTTENMGLSIRNITTIKNPPEQIYVALTGDQCALTGIRVHRD